MQVTSPETDSDSGENNHQQTLATDHHQRPEEVQVSPASVEMLNKLFPNKKRSVLELVLKRCNHDLLKAIEHFNLSNCKQEGEGSEAEKKIEGE